MYHNVVIETTSYLVLLRFLISMPHLIFLDVANYQYLCFYCLRQKLFVYGMLSTKCQVQNDRTNWETISFYVVFNQHLNLSAPTPFLFSSSNWCNSQEVCFLCIQYFQYIQYILHHGLIFFIRVACSSMFNYIYIIQVWNSQLRLSSY